MDHCDLPCALWLYLYSSSLYGCSYQLIDWLNYLLSLLLLPDILDWFVACYCVSQPHSSFLLLSLLLLYFKWIIFLFCNFSKSGLDEAEFSKLHSSVKRGDIVGVTGFPGLVWYKCWLICLTLNLSYIFN